MTVANIAVPILAPTMQAGSQTHAPESATLNGAILMPSMTHGATNAATDKAQLTRRISMTPKEQYEARKAERAKLKDMEYQIKQATEQMMQRVCPVPPGKASPVSTETASERRGKQMIARTVRRFASIDGSLALATKDDTTQGSRPARSLLH